MAKTEISTLGEFVLIKQLTKDIKHVQTSTQKGVGDDAAVMNFKDKRTLITTDLLLEGIHFNLEYVRRVSLNISSLAWEPWPTFLRKALSS